MSYLIGTDPRAGLRGDMHGLGLGYVGDLGATTSSADKNALKIAVATQQSQQAGQLMAAQLAWDAKAKALRTQLQQQNAVAKATFGKVLTSAQIEAEIIRRLGRRPVGTIGASSTVVVKPTASSGPVFTGSGADVSGGGSGPNPMLILGGLVGVGLLVTLARRG